MVRGGGELNLEIRPYHEDFVKRIYRIDFLSKVDHHGPYERKSIDFGFKNIAL